MIGIRIMCPSTAIWLYDDTIFSELVMEEDLKSKLDDKRDDFTQPIVTFHSIKSNIPAATMYGVYVPQLIRYLSDYALSIDFQPLKTNLKILKELSTPIIRRTNNKMGKRKSTKEK